MDTGQDWRPEEARKSLNRILPEVEQLFSEQIREADRIASIQAPALFRVGAVVRLPSPPLRLAIRFFLYAASDFVLPGELLAGKTFGT